MSKARNDITLVPNERIISRIFLIREKEVMLDRDLAELYQVRSIALRQQVKRNSKRFSEDFMFRLSNEEVDLLVAHL